MISQGELKAKFFNENVTVGETQLTLLMTQMQPTDRSSGNNKNSI